MQLFWGISSIIEAHFRTCFMYHSKVLTMSNVLVLLSHYPWQMWSLPCPPRLSLEFRKGGSLWKPSAIVAPRSGCARPTSPGEEFYLKFHIYIFASGEQQLLEERWPVTRRFLPLVSCSLSLSLWHCFVLNAVAFVCDNHPMRLAIGSKLKFLFVGPCH